MQQCFMYHNNVFVYKKNIMCLFDYSKVFVYSNVFLQQCICMDHSSVFV